MAGIIRTMTSLTLRSLCIVATTLAACTPTLNWRDVRAEGSSARWLFPCRPNVQERSIALAGAPVKLTLQACSAGGLTWGLAHADLVDPARVAPALNALQAGAAANLGTVQGAVTPRTVNGATPQPGSGLMQLKGQLPDGTAVHMQVLVFARGPQVFQASVIGQAPSEEAVETFFASIRFAP